MAIRNNLLGGTDWGEEGLKPTVDLNQTIDAIIEFAAKGQAQIPFTTLKATGNWTNEGNLAADRTTVAAGVNGTINTGSTTATFDTDHYEYNSNLDMFVIIEADSITTGPFAVNDCLIKQIDTKKWIVYCTVGNYEIRRAKIMKTLFYGTNGTNPAATSTNITNITAIKSSDSRDTGKIAHYAFAYVEQFNGGATGTTHINFDGVFANTTTNDNCSMWSRTFAAGSINKTSRFEIPTGTTINSTTSGEVDEFGTDTTSDQKNNPVDCKLYSYVYDNAFDYGEAQTDALILCEGDITWTPTVFDNTGSETPQPSLTSGSTDFNADHSIPAFGLATESPNLIIVDTGTLTLRGDEKSISIYNPSLIPTDTSIKVTLNDGVQNISTDTTLSENDTTIIPLTVTPTADATLELHYSLETTGAGTPEWYGYGVYKY